MKNIYIRNAIAWSIISIIGFGIGITALVENHKMNKRLKTHAKFNKSKLDLDEKLKNPTMYGQKNSNK